MLILLISLFGTLIICLHIYFRYSHGGRLIYKIKGPKEMFLFGNLFDIFLTPGHIKQFLKSGISHEVILLNPPHQPAPGTYSLSFSEQIFKSQIEWRKTYGSIWKLCGFNYRAVYLYKPEDIEVVLSSTQYIDKSMPYTFLYPWLREGLLTSTGEKWHQRRKMLTPAFHFQILKKFFTSFCERTDDLMKTIEKEVHKEKSDLIPLISRATLSVICETSMGTTTREDLDTLTNKYFKPLHTLANTVLYRICRLWLYSDFMFQFSQVAKVQKGALQNLHKFTTQIIQDRRQYRNINNITDYYKNDRENVYGKKTKLAMLDLLLDEEKKGRIDEEGIKEEVDTFMFEGHDTTAAALCFMIMRIANEPEVQNSIYEEMTSILGDSKRPPTVEEIYQMKYLECCIKESLRLYPSVHFIARYFKEDVIIGDYTIPYNTMVNINVFDIHRNPDVFPEPEKFVPERFLPENCVTRHPYAYIPFSAGPRNCIGQKFALMEMKTVMCSLLRRFRLEPVTTPDDLTLTSDLVLRTTTPIYVRFCNRNT